jgi:hypothetical protein
MSDKRKSFAGMANVMDVAITWKGSNRSNVSLPFDLDDKSVVQAYWAKSNTLFVKLVGQNDPEEFPMVLFPPQLTIPASVVLSPVEKPISPFASVFAPASASPSASPSASSVSKPRTIIKAVRTTQAQLQQEREAQLALHQTIQQERLAQLALTKAPSEAELEAQARALLEANPQPPSSITLKKQVSALLAKTEVLLIFVLLSIYY